MNQSEMLNKLYEKYNLTNDDIFASPQGWKIITRSGIDKLQAMAGIDITYELITFEPDVYAAVKAIGKLGDQRIETYGEATPKTSRQSYKLAMAEKRAMSRVVLKLTGFYQLGIFGEDEADDFAKTSNAKPVIKGTL